MRTLIARSGYELISARSHKASLTARLLRELEIDLVLDVGANQGQYASGLRRLGYVGRINSYEPSSAAYNLLLRNAANDANWETRRLALGSQAGRSDLYIAENSVSSSLLSVNDVHVDAAPTSRASRRESVAVERLDDVVDDRSNIWLKIDTQGYELEVLLGASNTLTTVKAVQVELSLVPLYKDQASMLEVLDLLTGSGFVLADLLPGFRDSDSGRLLQCDAIVVRSDALPLRNLSSSESLS